MPRLFEFNPADSGDYIDKLRAEFPTARFGWGGDLPDMLPADLETALAAGREEPIQSLLTQQPYVLQYAMPSSGHHGIWLFPKQMIKPNGADGSAGLIPDFLAVSRSSLGYYWHVVELKQAAVQFANVAGTALSTEANKGVVQCARYLTHFEDYIDAVRSSIRIDELIRPSGAILLIGDAASENDAQRRVRADFNRVSREILIVSYDRLRRGLANDVRSRSDGR